MAALRLAGALALVAAVAGGLWWTYDLGHRAGIAESAATLADWKRSVVEQANERRQQQQARYHDLQERFDELRQRPERVRTITRTVTVEADDRCDSLPGSYRRVWDAGYESGLRVGAATAATDMGDGPRVALADADAAIDDAKYAFERNAAALTAAQLYINNVCLAREPEQ